MVVGTQDPRVFLRQWNNRDSICQEFHFSTQLECKLLEYRNLTLLHFLQPFVLQVQLLIQLLLRILIQICLFRSHGCYPY